MTIQFNYYLTGTGWAEVFFISEGQSIRFDVSYFSDPLAELFEGLCRLLQNQSNIEKINFYDEPGEHSLIISLQEDNTFSIEIFWCDGREKILKSDKTSANKERVYSDSDTIKNFVSVICKGIDSFLNHVTPDEYKIKWADNDFPIDSYHRLNHLLKELY
jgi:hypothetical protein